MLTVKTFQNFEERCKCDAILSADIALLILDRNLRLEFLVNTQKASCNFEKRRIRPAHFTSVLSPC